MATRIDIVNGAQTALGLTYKVEYMKQFGSLPLPLAIISEKRKFEFEREA